jgi:hypothetical protein
MEPFIDAVHLLQRHPVAADGATARRRPSANAWSTSCTYAPECGCSILRAAAASQLAERRGPYGTLFGRFQVRARRASRQRRGRCWCEFTAKERNGHPFAALRR